MGFNTEINDVTAFIEEVQALELDAAEKLAAMQAEAKASLKHSEKIVPGSMFRANTMADLNPEIAAKWKAKFVCVIRTRGVDGEFDGNHRLVATSDLHQVHHTEAVKKELKKANRPAKASNKEVERLQALLAANGIDPSVATEETEDEFDLQGEG